MKVYKNPDQENWVDLITRPTIDRKSLQDTIENIFNQVRAKGDDAIRAFTLKFDQVWVDQLLVSNDEIAEAGALIDQSLKEAIDIAFKNITKFHQSQIKQESKVETIQGVTCWRKSIPIENVGLYIPGGTAPLFSSILMLAAPAKMAGCKNTILCTPPNSEGKVNPAILYTAQMIGVDKIFKVGGAQAIAGMTYGTSSIDRVDKLFGPGNQYVTQAKTFASTLGIAIDMPAGPSEVLVIADSTANPAFIASDLLSQAEHGVDSQVILLTNDEDIVNNTLEELKLQLENLPRKEIASKALENSKAILLEDLDSCFDLSNQYAPEHLIIASQNAEGYESQITNAGSVFLGNYSCESAGDYASGTNHTLPTNGFARSYSGVSMDSFFKQVTFQKLTAEGIKNLGPTIEKLAEAEELIAHKNAVSIRLKSLES